MKRLWAGAAAALCALLIPAAGALAQAAAPFPVLEVPPAAHDSHRLARAAMISGVALVAVSFVFEREADRTYDQYLTATDPADISSLYDRTLRYDRLSAGSLISGNALIATGLALRFIHRPHATHLELALGPRRCAVTCSF
ncbi:MAG: hypothetical protein HYR73_00765 [Candidatus Eisenbacteria bacterium]|nr:hypothetical protein [Candidatus Eisenbacteria bacterium]